MARVELIGWRELRASMRAAGIDLKELKEVNRAAGAAALPFVRARTPVGPDKGGHIRPTVRLGVTGKAAIIRIGDRRHPYGGPVHWGWAKRHIKPNTWATGAVKATEPKWVGIYMRHLQDLIDRCERT